MSIRGDVNSTWDQRMCLLPQKSTSKVTDWICSAQFEDFSPLCLLSPNPACRAWNWSCRLAPLLRLLCGTTTQESQDPNPQKSDLKEQIQYIYSSGSSSDGEDRSYVPWAEPWFNEWHRVARLHEGGYAPSRHDLIPMIWWLYSWWFMSHHYWSLIITECILFFGEACSLRTPFCMPEAPHKPVVAWEPQDVQPCFLAGDTLSSPRLETLVTHIQSHGCT